MPDTLKHVSLTKTCHSEQPLLRHMQRATHMASCNFSSSYLNGREDSADIMAWRPGVLNDVHAQGAVTVDCRVGTRCREEIAGGTQAL